MKKPRICEILGVEIGEEFRINGRKGKRYRITETGERQIFLHGEWVCCENEKILTDIINDPSLITAVDDPKFKPDEMAVLRLMKKAGVLYVSYETESSIRCEDIMYSFVIDVNLLPSLRKGDTLELLEMDLEA